MMNEVGGRILNIEQGTEEPPPLAGQARNVEERN